MKNSLIWIIEDDQMYRDTIVTAVRHYCKDAEVREFSTERDAERAIAACEDGKAPIPSLVICDVMLPYAFAEEGEKLEPAGWAEDRFRDAGVRIWKQARESDNETLRNVRWIYHTVLRPNTMGFDQHKDTKTFYLGKDRPLKDLGERLAWLYGDIDEKWEASEDEETVFISSNQTLRDALLGSVKVPLRECLPTLE